MIGWDDTQQGSKSGGRDHKMSWILSGLYISEGVGGRKGIGEGIFLAAKRGINRPSDQPGARLCEVMEFFTL